MKEQILALKDSLQRAWNDSPWARAVGVMGGTISGLLLLNSSLPGELALDLTALAPKYGQLTLAVLAILFFFLVSVFSGDRLMFEKKLRALEQSFNYDKRGTLYNGREPNIAFRIATFKGMLEGIADVVGVDQLEEALTETGRRAAVDFSKSISAIYSGDVASKRVGYSWSELSLEAKLDAWAEYDSATGWGILTCDSSGESVRVVINHLKGLFEGPGGLMFGHFLAGYAETVISQIVCEHRVGKYCDCGGVQLTSTTQLDRYSVELSYSLK